MSNLVYDVTLDIYCEGGENAIFSSPNDLLADFKYLEQYAAKTLMDRFENKEELFVKSNDDNNRCMDWFRGFIFVNLGTGNNKMLLAIINACNKIGLDLDLIDGNDSYEMWSKFY